jgi:predicted nucleotidyltransferase
MSTITELIPGDVLNQFLRQHMQCKLLVVAISGAHAHGYPNPGSPLELKGLHVEPTQNIVGLTQPPKAYSWVEEYEGFRIDYSSIEIGQAFNRLLRGDGSTLERILAPRHLIRGDDLRRLQKVSRGVICRRFYNYYKNFAKGVSRDFVETSDRSVRHILGVYRTALTGVHLLRTGTVEVDLMTLARKYRLTRIQELVDAYRDKAQARLKPTNPWINRIVKLHSLMEEAVETTKLPTDPDNPGAVEEYLLDMRRRFFDAPTIQQ